MTVALRLRANPQTTLKSLVACMEAAATARNHASDKYDVFNGYLRWANEWADNLSAVVRSEDVDRLILTRRHWLLQGLDPASHGDLFRLVHLELDQQIRALDEAIADLRGEIARWTGYAEGHLIVADSNVFLEHREPFHEIDWRTVAAVDSAESLTLVVPMLVVDELDSAKRDDLRHRARVTLKTLQELLAGHEQESVSVNDVDPRLSMRLMTDDVSHVRLPDSDSEILDRVLALTQVSQRSVTVATFDVGMALRAGALDSDRIVVRLVSPDQRRDPRAEKLARKGVAAVQ